MLHGMSTISIDERRRLCDEFGLDAAHLYQLLTGRREMEPMKAVELEVRSGGRLRRWHLRARTWHLVWPELVGTEGAPALPASEGEGCVAHGHTLPSAGTEGTPSQTTAGAF